MTTSLEYNSVSGETSQLQRLLQKLFSNLWIIQKPTPAGPKNEASPAILFVHGFTANAKDTWSKWFNAVLQEEELKQFRIDSFGYQTAVFTMPFGIRVPRIAEIAAGLSTEIVNKFGKSSAVFIVAHSLGGIIARQFIISEFAKGNDISRYRLIMFGTPNDGAALASLAKELGLISGQVQDMAKEGGFLDSLNASWDQHKIEQIIPVRYVIGGGDQIVNPESAGYSSSGSRTDIAIDLDHSSIIDVERALPFKIFANFVIQNTSRKGDPLFTVYNIQDEAFYFNRSIDSHISRAINSRHIWLYGESGIGKTSLLRRNALSSGWRLVPITLSTVTGDDPQAVQAGFLSRVADALDLDGITHADGFLATCRSLAEEQAVCFLIEEIPFADMQSYGRLAHWFSKLAEQLDGNSATCGRVRLLFSSINVPPADVSVEAKQTRDRITFVSAPAWSIDEVRGLLDLILKGLGNSIEQSIKAQVVAMSQGLPRAIKHDIRPMILNLDN